MEALLTTTPPDAGKTQRAAAEEVRREVKRLEDERLRLAPEVMGPDPAAVSEDRLLEQRIRELAACGRGHHPDGAIGAIEAEVKDDPGGAA
jgi:hypothetical protein